MNRRDLDRDGFLVVGGLLQGSDEHGKVFNGVNIMVGCRRDRIRANRDHARSCDLERYLFAWQMTANAGLGSLADFDLHGRCAVEILGVYSEAARCYLHDGALSELLPHLLGKAAFTGIEEGSRLPGSCRKRAKSIVADGSVGHGREEDGSFHHQIGRDLGLYFHISIRGTDIH